ncbi:hypothetical protein SAMN05421823_103410 [Catalinimonas alkaloidigena]|uniref:Uncharacterized protein n=1 Tax=Catalinimonas alkaloidigena TaxID=1075417 RepID=A0A1G9EBA3_9BACT|nr:hypothetical protein [Catalinimonas alkaloidigena]SDK73404.1 hypothetical protein SAMN05421823_103410 [Catalinimonas alkaloidigena]
MSKRTSLYKPKSVDEVFKPVTYADLSPGALRRARRQHAFGHWTFRYSLVAVASSLVAMGLFGMSEILFFLAASSSTLSAASVSWNYLANPDEVESRYVERIQRQLAQQTQERRTQLRAYLTEYNGQRGLVQMESLQKQFDALVEMLQTKFETTELTYQRYYGIAQEVFLASIDNLSEVALSLQSIDGIDVFEIQRRLKAPILMPGEREALQKRLALYEAEKRDIEQRYLENERAQTQIAETTVAISNIDVSNKEARLTMEEAMRELVELTKRAHEYSTPKVSA